MINLSIIFTYKAEGELNDYFYLLEKEHFQPKVDCAQFWMDNKRRFSTLYETALQYLSIPATSASCERLFSAAGLSTKKNRTTIGPRLLEAETCAKFNRKVVGSF